MQDQAPDGPPPDPVLDDENVGEQTLSFPVEPDQEPVGDAVVGATPEPPPNQELAAAVAAASAAIAARDVDAAPARATPGAMAVNPEASRDAELPPQGTDRSGSLPAVSRKRFSARAQLSNWRLYLVRAISAGLSVILAVIIVPGLSFVGWQWGQGIEIAVIFALLNAFVKPVLQFLSLRFLFSSYGIVIVLINTVLLWLLSLIMDDRLVATTLVSVLLGGVLIGVLGAAVDALLGADFPSLDRDYKERNGLS